MILDLCVFYWVILKRIWESREENEGRRKWNPNEEQGARLRKNIRGIKGRKKEKIIKENKRKAIIIWLAERLRYFRIANNIFTRRRDGRKRMKESKVSQPQRDKLETSSAWRNEKQKETKWRNKESNTCTAEEGNFSKINSKTCMEIKRILFGKIF